jgi:hypothetical protein
MVEKTITSTSAYWRPYGLPASPRSAETAAEEPFRSVHLPWNALIAEGLLSYGYRREAADLFNRMMACVLDNLKRENAFRRAYDADTGQGSGERNALEGLPPLSLFLDVLGLRLISPQRVALSGFNPFPWPVTVKYRGMTILRQKEKTMVIFPDGQTAVVEDPSPRIVSLEIGRE